MISFDLCCANDHVFEIWFRSSADHQDQAARGLIACPVCGDGHARKAAMAPNVAAKGNRRAAQRSMAPSAQTALPALSAPALSALPDEARPLLAAIARAQAAALAQSTWVGARFAAEARTLHAHAEAEGSPAPAIHGNATADEAEALLDDGIAIMPLLVPIVPPELQN